MKKLFEIIFSLTTASAMVLPVAAAVTLSNNSWNNAADFPAFSITGGVPLFYEDVLTTPAGATLAGSGSQGQTANAGFGEIFYYTGASGNILKALTIIDNGGGGVGTYQPFLFDLGTSIYNTGAANFNPSTQVNLLSTGNVQPPAFGSANFLEFDFSGADAVALTGGHSYAFGLVNNNGTADFTFKRSSGTQSDPNGDGFQFTGFSATSISGQPWGGGPRNVFFGLYTVVPEPSSVALLGVGLASLWIRRRHG